MKKQLPIISFATSFAFSVVFGSVGAHGAEPTKRYIVTLKPGVDAAHYVDKFNERSAQRRKNSDGIEASTPSLKPERLYHHAIRGFVADLTADQVADLSAEQLYDGKNSPDVLAIEPDSEVVLHQSVPLGFRPEVVSSPIVPVGIRRMGMPGFSLFPAPGEMSEWMWILLSWIVGS